MGTIKRAAAWQEAGARFHQCLPLIVHGNTLLSVVGAILSQAGLASACLELELAESVAMRNVDASIVMLSTVKAMGVQLSIDDVETGCSSLSYLHCLPIGRVKINQSFIQEVLTQTRPPVIVRAIIAMAHNLDLFVPDKGVEQEAQRTVQLDERRDYAQGYLFGRPMPADAFTQMLQPAPLREAC